MAPEKSEITAPNFDTALDLHQEDLQLPPKKTHCFRKTPLTNQDQWSLWVSWVSCFMMFLRWQEPCVKKKQEHIHGFLANVADPIGSMEWYIYLLICHKNQLNVGNYAFERFPTVECGEFPCFTIKDKSSCNLNTSFKPPFHPATQKREHNTPNVADFCCCPAQSFGLGPGVGL